MRRAQRRKGPFTAMGSPFVQRDGDSFDYASRSRHTPCVLRTLLVPHSCLLPHGLPIIVGLCLP
jgi:hypothetical protein